MKLVSPIPLALVLITLGVASTRAPANAQVSPRSSISAGPTTATSQTIDGNAHGWGGQATLWLALPHVPLGLREARYHRYDQIVGRGHMVPVTLGVRF